MVIIEKPNDIKLTRPSVTIDIPLNPKPKAPLPNKNGFAICVTGPSGSGKSSVMFSLIKSKDGYRKRFHKIISVIPESSLNSLKANPLKDLPEEQRFEDLTLENLDDIIEMVEENREEDLLTLLLLDDVSAELQDPLILKKMMRLYLNRRHLKLSIISISHSLTGRGALPYTIRKNLSHLIMFKPSSSIINLSVELAKHIYAYGTREQLEWAINYLEANYQANFADNEEHG
eukprot:SAG22_NODE_1082_length_5646_cov_20.621597_5_plen_230_part_01